MPALRIAIAFALFGSVGAICLPAFLSNLRASRFAEPMEGLSHIAGRAALHASGLPPRLAFPESVGLTPATVPHGKREVDEAGTWDHPTWRLLDFAQADAHYYAFEFERHGDDLGARFIARARGDLDGDGQTSEFSIVGEVLGDGYPFIYPMRIEREVE